MRYQQLRLTAERRESITYDLAKGGHAADNAAVRVVHEAEKYVAELYRQALAYNAAQQARQVA